MRTLSYNDLNILLGERCAFEIAAKQSNSLVSRLIETLLSEVERMKTVVKQLAECSDREVMSVLRPKQSLVSQAVKMVCALLGNIETLEVRSHVEQLSLARISSIFNSD
jgi:hypothetical protein